MDLGMAGIKNCPTIIYRHKNTVITVYRGISWRRQTASPIIARMARRKQHVRYSFITICSFSFNNAACFFYIEVKLCRHFYFLQNDVTKLPRISLDAAYSTAGCTAVAANNVGAGLLRRVDRMVGGACRCLSYSTVLDCLSVCLSLTCRTASVPSACWISPRLSSSVPTDGQTDRQTDRQTSHSLNRRRITAWQWCHFT